MHAQQVLFENEVPELGEVLFQSAADLARKLIEWGLQAGSGKERSLSSYLAQILISNTRNCPDRLRQAILDGVRKRLGKMSEVDQDAWVDRVERAIRMDEISRRGIPMDAEQLYNELLELSDNASVQFIITARPAEDVPSPKAAMLTELLLLRTGLLEHAMARKQKASKEPNRSVQYVFNFPTNHGVDWWKSLHNHLVGQAEARRSKVDPDNLKRAISRAEQEGRIQVQEVPESMCGCPTVVFDPHLPVSKGFNLYYHQGPGDQQLVSPALMDSQALALWKKYVYWPIRNGEVEVNVISCNLD